MFGSWRELFWGWIVVICQHFIIAIRNGETKLRFYERALRVLIFGRTSDWGFKKKEVLLKEHGSVALSGRFSY